MERNPEKDLKVLRKATLIPFFDLARESLPYYIKRTMQLEETLQRLKSQILTMKNCLNCDHGDSSNTCSNTEFKAYTDYQACIENNFRHWKPKRKAVSND